MKCNATKWDLQSNGLWKWSNILRIFELPSGTSAPSSWRKIHTNTLHWMDMSKQCSNKALSYRLDLLFEQLGERVVGHCLTDWDREVCDWDREVRMWCSERAKEFIESFNFLFGSASWTRTAPTLMPWPLYACDVAIVHGASCYAWNVHF